MEDNDAAEAEATEALAEAGSVLSFALMGVPTTVFSLVALIAALASASEVKETYQLLVLASAETELGRIFPVVNAVIKSIGLHSAGMSGTTTTVSFT